MSRRHLKTGVLLSIAVWQLSYVQPLAAQVIPDNTLPVGERSLVTGNPNYQIDGGAKRGSNLFHSFQSFSVPTGGSAYFNNATDVQNIFTRVTGSSRTNIDGVIRANGVANLFLLNPNGIVFGAGARLNIGGSFVASTANSINFADSFQYSATSPQTTPLLTVSVPVGLQMGVNPGRIAVQGNGYNLSGTLPVITALVRGNASTGLVVPAGQTLALIGGDIDIQGGVLTAEQGQIELGSVRDGIVNLGKKFTLNYPGIQTFGNIHLSQQALIDTSGSPGGSIQVQGNRVLLLHGSLMLIQNQGEQAAGNLRVNAADSLELSGISSSGQLRGGLNTETIGSGRGADVAVSTRQFAIRDGAGIVTPSYGAGRTGDVTVSADDSAQLIGYVSTLVSNISALAYSSGNVGNITLSTRRLSLLNGAIIGATAGDGSGNAGNVNIDATESVELIGVGSFTVSNVSSSSSLRSTGNGGNVTINTSRLVGRDGGSVTALTLGTGRAGSVTINATESVELSGIGQVPLTDLLVPSQVSSSAQLFSATVFPERRIPNQNSGDVTINTGRLSVTDSAKVDVSHEGTASAGTVRINANSILLDRKGTISAATASGEGGNINLSVRDVLLLSNNSPITASADGTGNGGNIRIKTSSLVAVKNENSDIRANSVNARGGNVIINASGIFGTQFRRQDTASSDITASGVNSALSGTVQLNIEQPDPISGLVELPVTLVDSSNLIATGCPATEGNSFVITGRGGLPPTPEQQLDDDAEWLDRRRLTVSGSPQNSSLEHPLPAWTSQSHSEGSSPMVLVEATRWRTTPTGEIVLFSDPLAPIKQSPSIQLRNCQQR
ncbi:filamentous hemagglutinin N-terminal domain-containing protein [Tolypothrix campylonemoides VB511288_2]|uniref:Filamentous hemagglutinin N-terminal domain-containing protein n=4 Tax=Cyanophyceae TaxID=3028117 RepID=A0A8S9TDQ5_9CYAN|nr:filamentous hemagglutinin N-terminal domain-containing protein [Tolypothrix bouteillei]KAF3890107.1 filamentous hemagglutinin N-terminal domain-containing protein [Tolypothrix bouteillei VB521301]